MAALRAKDIITSPIPDLLIGPNHTTRDALHSLKYVGELGPWEVFERDVWQESHNGSWANHQAVLAHRPKGRVPGHSLFNEHVHVGDEMGVTGRFTNNVGQAVSGACAAFELDIAFSDYRATTNKTMQGRVPDSVCATSNGELRVVGEVKTPWVQKHATPFLSGRF